MAVRSFRCALVPAGPQSSVFRKPRITIPPLFFLLRTAGSIHPEASPWEREVGFSCSVS